MQNKEPERGNPSGYAFGVKCSAILSGRRLSGAAFQFIGIPRSQATWFPFGKPTYLREKTRYDE